MKAKGKKIEKKSSTEKVEELFDALKEGVANFEYSIEYFKAILEMKSLMPNYSYRNLLVAKQQLPNATFLASYKHWQSLGRHVGGQKAIRIFKPCFKKVESQKDGGLVEESKLYGFVTVPVFDVSQTKGAPLPIDKIQLSLEGESEEARRIMEFAKIFAKEHDCPIRYSDDTNGAKGYYSITRNEIVIATGNSINQQAKTMVHELVHMLVDRWDNERTSKEKEVVAESTAYVVCRYFGLDTSSYSFEYVKGWSNKDEEAVMTYGERICDISKQFIKRFEEFEADCNESNVSLAS